MSSALENKWLVHKKFRVSDLLVILLCLLGAAISINLFWKDLYQTISSIEESKPIGTISIKNNNVQRRMGDRILWGRLSVESPVYIGDIIRVAELSAALLDIDKNHIELGENTLIRVQIDENNEGLYKIELAQGTMDLVASNESRGITINAMGKEINVGPGTALLTGTSEEGLIIKVTEGSIIITDLAENKAEETELTAGMMLSLDPVGEEKIEPGVVMLRPRPNVRLLKNNSEPLVISFNWNRINLDAKETLQLEIAEDRSFNRIIEVKNNLNDNTEAVLGNGTFHWRILTKNNILSNGQITILDSSGPELLSPVRNRLYSYQTDLPQIRFEWAEIDNASGYFLEVSETPEFLGTAVKKETASAFSLESALGQGIWYWRVMPVFPSAFEGNSAYSEIASFNIIQSKEAVELIWPEPAPEPLSAEDTSLEAIFIEEIQPEPEKKLPAPVLPPPPPPPLPAPLNLYPASGYIIGIAELKTQRNIDFEWAAVPGANEYTFTLFEQNANGRRIIISNNAINNNGWTLTDIGILDRGTYIWQVEAMIKNQNGGIERHGITAENTFTIDIPMPLQPQVQIELKSNNNEK